MPDGVKRPIKVLIAGFPSSFTGPLTDVALTSPDIGEVDLVTTLKEAVEKAEAEEIKKKLEAAGASVELK